MNSKGNIKIIISGGGTGGHIFPAIAIAKAIQSIVPKAEFLFIGALHKMEMEKVPEAGFTIEGLWISGFQRNLSLQNLAFPFKLISSLWKARRLIKRFKPDIAIGVGGFASGPTLKMASSMGIPCLIQEQNSYPGITNKLLANQVKKICVAYEGMEKYFPKEKIQYTGNPIRKQVIEIEGKKEEALSFFNLKTDKRTILIVGGSLGARSINNAILKHLKEWGQIDVQIIWQTGKTGIDAATEALAQNAIPQIKAYAFIKRMDLAYAAADLIISRAGAIAISEIAAVAKPVIFVPLPTAAEDHQTMNAQQLVDKKAAIMVADKIVNEKLLPMANDLIRNETTLKEMANEIKKLGIKNADELIAKKALELIKWN